MRMSYSREVTFSKFFFDFALLSSANEKNRYNEINPNIDKRTSRYKRRQEAITKTTELIEPMIKRALDLGVGAKYCCDGQLVFNALRYSNSS